MWYVLIRITWLSTVYSIANIVTAACDCVVVCFGVYQREASEDLMQPPAARLFQRVESCVDKVK